MTAYRRLRLGLALVVGLLLMAAALTYIVPFRSTASFVAADYQYGLAYQKHLADISVITQKTAYTCNVASMAIVSDYFGTPATEDSIRAELGLLDREKGMLPKEYLTYATQLFAAKNITVAQHNPASETEILNLVSSSLHSDQPVVMFYSTPDQWHLPNYDTHYAVIYALDMANQTVSLSNPYGYLEQLSFQDLFDGLDFTNYQNEPFAFKLARRFGLVKSNTLFTFEPQKS